MTHRCESPVQLMVIIKEQCSSRVGVIAKKKGSHKIAEINFDPADRAISEILHSGIRFDDLKTILIPCHALDDDFNVVRVRLSNLPFLKKDMLWTV
ncbi:hypothetical protein RMATCC62417_11671 [Rhizopus microsporus]|nr:hypothetical protein RMATCC62417_11671 [Rhizopus microsporus]